MKWPSLTLIFSGLFVAYIANSIWTIGSLFYPASCPPDSQCIQAFLATKPKLQIWVYTSLRSKVTSESQLNLITTFDKVTVGEEIEKQFNISIPVKTQKNGTLHIHVYLTPRGALSPFSSPWKQYQSSQLTTYTIPRATTFKLISDDNELNTTQKAVSRDKTVSHWRSQVTVSIMEENITFNARNIPNELLHLISVYHNQYLPMLYIDELGYRTRDLLPINTTITTLPLTVTYKPISVGKLRLWITMQMSMAQLHKLGFSEKDTDDMKGIFADTNLYFLLLTFTVAAFHLLFDVLAFKNDISYWKNRQTMVGLSRRTVVWRCVSTFIIFLYLLDEETSLLVLIPAGVGSIIEVWKVKKAFKVTIFWSGWKPSLQFGSATEQELQTQQFDTQAMKYLSYLLYPLCLGGAVYSLVYTPHKSWYSWTVQSMVNGVYAFGFLFMLPQLFVNYKLKSVAHLPWRAFMYKAFNTFIDDIFAFIIVMPTAHRLACFRDDIVFLVYLYQRYLYPVDHTRVNEYGQSFEKVGDGDESKKDK